MNFPNYNGGSKFDGLTNDAQQFRQLADRMLELAENDQIQNGGNKGILAFIAGGLMDAAAGMEEFIEDEVQRN